MAIKMEVWLLLRTGKIQQPYFPDLQLQIGIATTAMGISATLAVPASGLIL